MAGAVLVLGVALVGAAPLEAAGCIVLGRCAYARGGEVFVADRTDAVPARLTLGASAVGRPQISPDGTQVLFVQSGAGIYMVPAAPGGVALVAPVRLPTAGFSNADNNPAWSPTGQKIAFERNGQIMLMNGDGSGPIALFAGSQPTWSPDGTELGFVSGVSLRVSNLGGTFVRTVATAEGLNAPRWSFNGFGFCFTAGSMALPYIVPARGGTPSAAAPLPGPAEWLPDSSGLSIVTTSGSIVTMVASAPPSGSEGTAAGSSTGTGSLECTLIVTGGPHTWQRPPPPVIEADPQDLDQAAFDFAPDESGIAYCQRAPRPKGCVVEARMAYIKAGGDIVIADRTDGPRVQITRGAAAVGRPQLSPDGTQVLYVVTNTGIFHVPAFPGAPITRFPTVGASVADTNPNWSPDGGRILFQRSGQILMMNRDGSSPRVIASGVEPSWAPDGRHIAFVNGNTLMVANDDGTGARSVTTASLMSDPRWSYDGSGFVFFAGGTSFAFVVPASGGPPTQVTTFAGIPEWLPDGSGLGIAVPGGDVIALRPASPDGGRCLLMKEAGSHTWQRRARPPRYALYFQGRGNIENAVARGLLPISSVDLRVDEGPPPSLAVIGRQDAAIGPGTLSRIPGAIRLTREEHEVMGWAPIAFSPNGTNVLFTDVRGQSHLVSRTGSGVIIDLTAGGVFHFMGYVRLKGLAGASVEFFIVGIDPFLQRIVMFPANPDGTLAGSTPIPILGRNSLAGICLTGFAIDRYAPRPVFSGVLASAPSTSEVFVLPDYATLVSSPLAGQSDPRLVRVTEAGTAPPSRLNVFPSLSPTGDLVFYSSEMLGAGFEIRCGDGVDNHFGGLALGGRTAFQLHLSPAQQPIPKVAVRLFPNDKNQFMLRLSHNGMLLGFLQDTHPGFPDSVFQIYLATLRFRHPTSPIQSTRIESGGGDEIECPAGAIPGNPDIIVEESTQIRDPSRVPAGFGQIRRARELTTASGVTSFNQDLLVRLAFTREEFSDSELATLAPFFHDQAASVWRKIDGATVDTVNLRCIFKVNHFTTFGLSASSGASASSGGSSVSAATGGGGGLGCSAGPTLAPAAGGALAMVLLGVLAVATGRGLGGAARRRHVR